MPVLDKLCLLALVALPSFGQTMQSPLSTVIFHTASRSLRPIIGMTGSSYLGPALYADLDFASVSPDQKTAIIESANRVILIRNMQDAAEIETAITAVNRILWSNDSSIAILFSSANQQLQWVVNGKAGSVTSLPENARLLTAQSDASMAIVAAGGRIYRITPDAAPVQIAALGDPTAAAINGDTIYIADAAAHQIFQLSDNTQYPLLGPTDGIEDPTALLMSADGVTLYVAMTSARSLSAYSTVGKTLTTRLTLDWAPSSFEALSKETFLLNPGAKVGEPFSVLSTRNGLSQSFIPTGDAK